MPEDFEDDLEEAFRAESEEHLQVLARELVAIEEQGSAPSSARIELIFRCAHSLKGAARAVANWPVEEAAAALEAIFVEWKRAGEAPPNAPFDQLHEIVNLLPPLLENPSAPEAGRLPLVLEKLCEAGHLTGDIGLGMAVPAHDEPKAKAEEKPRPAPSPAQPPEPVPAEEQPGHRRQSMVRISHDRLNELVVRADEALSVKLSARYQALALRRLSDSLEAMRWQLRVSESSRDQPSSGAEAATFLEHIHEEIQRIERSARDHERSSGRTIDELRSKAQEALMRPASHLLDVFPKTIRDLSHSQGKRVELVMSGGHLSIDQRIIEGLTDPLNHLVRNAVDHGIETPGERADAGKPGKGRLEIRLFQPHPGRIELIIRDDGAGLPLEALRERAVERGLLSPEAAENASPEALSALIFESGFSTRQDVSAISGRGLGLAIVREKIERLGGQVSVRSESGRGATFLVTVPSTMVVFRGLALKIAGQIFVLPVGQVEGVVGFRSEQLVSTQDTPTLPHGGENLPMVDLALLLQLPHAAEPAGNLLRQAVVVRSASDRAALVVDEVVREDDFPIRPFTEPLVRLKGILGAAVTPGGEVLPVLQVADLLESAFHWVTPGPRTPATLPRQKEERDQKTLLVADDSITSRALLKNILESAGYNVVLAVDGRDALSALRLHPVQLVVSDVEMPGMDGFHLTMAIRKDPVLADLPVILVTALATPEDREKGLESGANQYIVKTDFEQGHLLEAVERLL